MCDCNGPDGPVGCSHWWASTRRDQARRHSILEEKGVIIGSTWLFKHGQKKHSPKPMFKTQKSTHYGLAAHEYFDNIEVTIKGLSSGGYADFDVELDGHIYKCGVNDIDHLKPIEKKKEIKK